MGLGAGMGNGKNELASDDFAFARGQRQAGVWFAAGENGYRGPFWLKVHDMSR